MGVWIVIGAGCGVGSFLIGLALARVLGTIGRDISDLHERELWLDRPMLRERDLRVAHDDSGRHADERT